MPKSRRAHTGAGGTACRIEPAPLAHWFFWVELLILSSTGIVWLYKMNQSLGLYDPLFISTRTAGLQPRAWHPPGPVDSLFFVARARLCVALMLSTV